MADFIYAKESEIEIGRFTKIYADNKLQPMKKLFIFGTSKTYTHIQRGDNFVTILGYCCYPGESIYKTATRILESFNESIVLDFKKQLIGQFIVIVKKDALIYIFADALQTRNLFYSEDFKFISSSFSIIEDNLNTNTASLDFNKVFEYIAMNYILYPSWLGNKTMHKNIRRLRPFEYIVIDTSISIYRVGAVFFTFNNSKIFNLNKICSNLLIDFKTIIENSIYRDKEIAVTLTGGYDSRLVAAIATNYYKKVFFRITTSQSDNDSIRDLKFARKIAKTVNIPLKDYYSTIKEIKSFTEQFYFLVEGFFPIKGVRILPIVKKTESYMLGLGGCFGSELFMPLYKYSKIEDYIEGSILKAKNYINADENTWKQLRLSMLEEFDNIKKHYMLSIPNPTDEIRIFILLNTIFFSSFLFAAYNFKGLQVEPYGHLNILEIALKVPEKYIKKHKVFRWSQLVQKKAMSKIYYNMGKIMTIHYQPMVPCTIRSFSSYLFGI